MKAFCLALLFVVLAAVFTSAQQSPDALLCVSPNMAGNGQVNLSSIAPASYSAQLTSSTQGLIPVTVYMGWCKPLNQTLCSGSMAQSGYSMVIVNTATNQCVAAFNAVAGPALPVSNTSYNFNEWAVQGKLASVTVTCDSKIPAGTAVLAPNVIINHPLSEFTLSFNSSAACSTSSSSSKKIFRRLGH